MFTLPDTSTGWDVVQQRLQRALDGDLVEQYPAAWAVLAVDAMSCLPAIVAAPQSEALGQWAGLVPGGPPGTGGAQGTTQ